MGKTTKYDVAFIILSGILLYVLMQVDLIKYVYRYIFVATLLAYYSGKISKSLEKK